MECHAVRHFKIFVFCAAKNHDFQLFHCENSPKNVFLLYFLRIFIMMFYLQIGQSYDKIRKTEREVEGCIVKGSY